MRRIFVSLGLVRPTDEKREPERRALKRLSFWEGFARGADLGEALEPYDYEEYVTAIEKLYGIHRPDTIADHFYKVGGDITAAAQKAPKKLDAAERKRIEAAIDELRQLQRSAFDEEMRAIAQRQARACALDPIVSLRAKKKKSSATSSRPDDFFVQLDDD